MTNKIAISLIFFPVSFFSLAMGSEGDSKGQAHKHEAIFTDIFKNNIWADAESVSGSGSSLYQTVAIRKAIPPLLQHFSIRSMLDIPCGDFNWIKTIDLENCRYIGVDIVQDLIDNNNALYGNQGREFILRNAVIDLLPKVDLILCRDMLVHFTLLDAQNVLRNLKRSGARYLLITTHPQVQQNTDIETGDWRRMNFEKAPFNFPKPLAVIHEHSPDPKEFDKSLGLWDFEDINFE